MEPSEDGSWARSSPHDARCMHESVEPVATLEGKGREGCCKATALLVVSVVPRRSRAVRGSLVPARLSFRLASARLPRHDAICHSLASRGTHSHKLGTGHFSMPGQSRQAPVSGPTTSGTFAQLCGTYLYLW